MKHIFSKSKYPAEVYPGMTVIGKYWCGPYKGSMIFVCVYKHNNEIWFLGTRSIVGDEIYIQSSNIILCRNSLSWNQVHNLTFKVKLYLYCNNFTEIGKIPSYKDIEAVSCDNNFYCIDHDYWLSRESTIAHAFYVNKFGYIREVEKENRTTGVVPIVKLRFSEVKA